MSITIDWRVQPCPAEYRAQVELELEKLSGGPSPYIFVLDNLHAVTAWNSCNGIHARYHSAQTKIVWHGRPCPSEYLARVEAELAGMLGGMLDSPQQLICHEISLSNLDSVAAWGEMNSDAFHAEYRANQLGRGINMWCKCWSRGGK